jgi:hypothetical protein
MVWAKKAEKIDMQVQARRIGSKTYKSYQCKNQEEAIKTAFNHFVETYNNRLEMYILLGKYKEWVASLDQEPFKLCDNDEKLKVELSKLFTGSAWCISGTSASGIIAARNKYALDGFYIRRLFCAISDKEDAEVELQEMRDRGYPKGRFLPRSVCEDLGVNDNNLDHKCIWEIGKAVKPAKRDKEHNRDDRFGKNAFVCYTRLDQVFAFEKAWKSCKRILSFKDNEYDLRDECIEAWLQEIVFVGVILEQVLSRKKFEAIEKNNPTKWLGETND